MSGAEFRIDLEGLAEAQALFDRVSSFDKPELLESLAARAKDMVVVRITETRRSAAGVPWAPWSEHYAKRRGIPSPPQPLLFFKGHLLNSLTSYVAGDEGIVETGLEYAATHHFGDPSRNIPARPFNELDDDNQQELAEEASDFIRRLVEGR